LRRWIKGMVALKPVTVSQWQRRTISANCIVDPESETVV
jgi:hypothetical protein